METITIELRYSTAEMNKLFLGKKEDASAVWLTFNIILNNEVGFKSTEAHV